MNPQIEQAIDRFRCASGKYAKTERYYRGDHDLAFATEKFVNAFGTLFREFAMNLCPAICDAVRDKLRVTGFSVADAGLGEERTTLPRSGPVATTTMSAAEQNAPPASTTPVEMLDRGPRPAGGTDTGALRHDIDRIWFRNRMAERAGEIHKEALKNGDAYAVVWFDPLGEVTIYPHRAGSVTVEYDEEQPGRIFWAAKYWRTPDKHTRVNIFYPDRIERYVTRKASEVVLPEAGDFVAFTPVLSTGFSRPGVGHMPAKAGTQNAIANPFGVVPVFHFANNADVGCMGQSELAPAIPIQDGLNKSILDMLVAMEFSAYRQRWAAGIEVEYDDNGQPKEPFSAGAERLWIATDPNTSFGDFNASNLDQFLKVKDSFRVDMASVTGTPLHYFLQNQRGFASGESLKQNETRFLAKIRDRQASFGQTWAELMSFALRLAGHGPVELITQWEDPSPMSEKDILGNILLKKQIGLSTEQALREAGDGEVDVKRMLQKPARQ